MQYTILHDDVSMLCFVFKNEDIFITPGTLIWIIMIFSHVKEKKRVKKKQCYFLS